MKTKKLSVKELLQSTDCGKEVVVNGWVRTKRGNKQVNFIALNDGSTINNIQVVVDMEKFSEEVMKRVTTGAALRVTGDLVESTGSGQAREIQARELTVLGEADPEKYPIQPKKHSLEFLREVAHLRFRTNIFGAVFRIRHHTQKLFSFFYRCCRYAFVRIDSSEFPGGVFSNDTLLVLNL